MNIPTQQENPEGLHFRYIIEKTDRTPIDPRAEYFVMRLDEYGSDKKHIAACRKAILMYAEEIKDHLPQLSKDLINRYGHRNAIMEALERLQDKVDDMRFKGDNEYHLAMREEIADYIETNFNLKPKS